MGRAVLEIPGRLPGLNEYIEAERTNRQMAANMKRLCQERVILCVRQQLRGVHFSRMVRMNYLWIEKNRRRDKDNISSFGRKVIQDAVVRAGLLEGDGWSHVDDFSDKFGVDPQNPRIIVTIEEVAP